MVDTVVVVVAAGILRASIVAVDIDIEAVAGVEVQSVQWGERSFHQFEVKSPELALVVYCFGQIMKHMYPFVAGSQIVVVVVVAVLRQVTVYPARCQVLGSALLLVGNRLV